MKASCGLTQPGGQRGAAGEVLVGAAEGEQSLAGPLSLDQPLRCTQAYCVEHKLHRQQSRQHRHWVPHVTALAHTLAFSSGRKPLSKAPHPQEGDELFSAGATLKWVRNNPKSLCIHCFLDDWHTLCDQVWYMCMYSMFPLTNTGFCWATADTGRVICWSKYNLFAFIVKLPLTSRLPVLPHFCLVRWVSYLMSFWLDWQQTGTFHWRETGEQITPEFIQISGTCSLIMPHLLPCDVVFCFCKRQYDVCICARAWK